MSSHFEIEGFEVRSLDGLPLDILLRILGQLEFSDLKNVSETCWTLRLVANETLMYHSVLQNLRTRHLWTKRYFFDTLRMLRRQQPGFDFRSLSDTTIIQSLWYLQVGVRKVSGNFMRLLEADSQRVDDDDDDDNRESSNGNCKTKYIEYDDIEDYDYDERIPDNSDCYSSSISDCEEDDNNEEEQDEEDDDISSLIEIESDNDDIEDKICAVNDTPCKKGVIASKPVKIDKEGLKYLRILQGFHKVGAVQAKSKQTVEKCTSTPTKYGMLMDDVEFTPLSTINSLLKRIDSSADSHHVHINSPDSFGVSHSRSGSSSVFSDSVPKLTDNLWSKIYELEHQSFSSSDSDSSSSTEFIRKLQSSKKVKDKAVLFERLLAKNKDKNASYIGNTGVPASCSSSTKLKKPHVRKISDNYMEAVRRSASPVDLLNESSPDGSGAFINGTGRGRPTKHSKTHHRRKLKASVMDGNRICYEKI